MTRAIDPGPIFKPADIAARWDVQPELVVEMCRDGRLPGAFKAGREWRVSQLALFAYETRTMGEAAA